jgi:hypothetical protein
VIENERLRVFNEDGRIYLSKTQKKYDLIVLDAYSRTYVPFHLMTLQFFEVVSSHLKPDGVVVSNLVSPLTGPASKLLVAEFNTVRQIFGQTYVFRIGTPSSEPDKNYENTQNLALVTTISSQRLTKNQLLQRADDNSRIRIANFRKCVETLVEDNFDTKGIVLTDDYAPVETLLNPLTGRPIEKTEIEFRPSIDLRALTTPAFLAVLVVVLWLHGTLTSAHRRSKQNSTHYIEKGPIS